MGKNHSPSSLLERLLKMDKILLIDGNSIVYRAFYGSAYGPAGIMTNSKGFPVNAISTFNRMITKSISMYEPSHVFVAFDAGKQTFRHEKLESYKGGRQSTPPELIQQFPEVKKMLGLMGIKSYEIKNIEADDIIGTLSKNFSEFSEVLVLSSDKDLHQLVKERVTVIAPQNGPKPDKILNITNFFIETGMYPIQVPDFKGIVGDASDNLPGVKGIGLKGAIKLLDQYDTLEGVYENMGDLTPKMQEKLVESKEMAFLCKELATLKFDVEVPYTFDEMKWNNDVSTELIDFFRDHEIHSLVNRYSKMANIAIKVEKTPEKEDKQLAFDNIFF